jgi:hypothetical protein
MFEARKTFVHMTAIPAGEAPLWGREQWQGLLLPLAQGGAMPANCLTCGAFSCFNTRQEISSKKTARQF